MTKVITILIIVVVLYGGWQLFFYWERVKNEEETQKKQVAATAVVPEQLPGLPDQLEASLKAAQNKGSRALGEWLKTYGSRVQDPRKAWIELDYCVMLAAENPAEARRIFAEVKRRTPPSSPIWPRIHALEQTFG